MSAIRDRFIEAWQEQHKHDVWIVAWVCPLCREVIQPFDLETQQRAINRHVEQHGQDWGDLMRAASPGTAP